MGEPTRDIPDWLTSCEHYRPGKDRDGFVLRNILSLTSLLERMRLETPEPSRLTPSAPTKLLCGFVAVLLTSLARNYFFVLVVLACTLLRACLLPRKVLARVIGGATGAAALALVITLPALLIGQPQSAAMLATKAFASCAIVLSIALTTPYSDLTSALRLLRVPSIVILTLDLTLHGIVRLGTCAADTLCALRMRSVGRNHSKQASMGGVAGSVLVRAGKASRDTHDAMSCRGFDGSYELPAKVHFHAADALWVVVTCVLFILFLQLQGA